MPTLSLAARKVRDRRPVGVLAKASPCVGQQPLRARHCPALFGEEALERPCALDDVAHVDVLVVHGHAGGMVAANGLDAHDAGGAADGRQPQPHLQVVGIGQGGAVVAHLLLRGGPPDHGVGADAVDRGAAELADEVEVPRPTSNLRRPIGVYAERAHAFFLEARLDAVGERDV